jgi:Concanavalin A-like lectin/glucanases superfamily
MRPKPPRGLVAATLVVCSGCGSTANLVIGSQAEVQVEAGPQPSCGDGGSRDDVEPPADGGCSNLALCAVLKTALVHRYSFNGMGTIVTDSVGSAHGTVVNAQLHGDGTLFLAGQQTDQYVDLPNGIIRQLVNATFEAWVTWNGCGAWERVFDFGDSGNPENTRDMASTTLYLTPKSMNGRDVMFGAFKRANQEALYETRAASNQPLPTGTMVHVALVVDDAGDQMVLYRNGAFEGSVAFADSLSLLNDINNWLGRSQYAVDPSFSGTFHEFRIYNVALSAPAIQTSFLGGPDASFLD